MVYTNTVPQSNQTIASTTIPINNNFIYLQTGIGTEHNFNAAGTGSDMYHLKASMPNISNPVALPAGTAGIYYVRGDVPRFYNGTINYIQTSLVDQGMIKTTVALNDTATHGMVTVPDNSVGQYYIFRKADTTAFATGFFVSGSGYVNVGNGSGFDPEITIGTSGLIISAKLGNAAYVGTYVTILMYYTP